MISQRNTAQRDNPSRRLDLENLDKFVKITEAARLLDYASVISVKKLVDDGMLTLYSLPETSRPRILLSELLELKSKQTSLRKLSPLGRGKSGRPRKYVQ